VTPGLVIVWAGERAVTRVIRTPLVAQEAFVIGREQIVHDEQVSGRHLSVYARENDILITDLRSRNGTFVNGEQVKGQCVVQPGAVLRAARSVGVVLLDVEPYEQPRPGDPLAYDAIATLAERTVRELAPDLSIHASFVELCLMGAWSSRDQLVAAVRAAVASSQKGGHHTLRARDLGEVQLRDPVRPFAELFEHIMQAPPPFEIVRPYHVLTKFVLDGVRYEQLIAAGEESPIVTQMHIRTLYDAAPGYFQAGFWGHGVNSYSVYYARVTERMRVFLRFPYGDGVYASDPVLERREALAKLAKYSELARTLPVAHVTLIDSMGSASYELRRHDGSIVRSEGDLTSLDLVDLVALAHGA
jgi:pSer/pThr/pTyr-binding forkhead associated (FHA) protein